MPIRFVSENALTSGGRLQYVMERWQFVCCRVSAGHATLQSSVGKTNFKGLADFEDAERQEANKRYHPPNQMMYLIK
jgi:hypothetical protein